MPIGAIRDLKAVRERLLGFSFAGAARLSGVRAERLRAIEEGAPPTIWELEVLGRLYGIDADLLADEPIHISPGDVVAALASTEEFHEVGDATRSAVVAAARAARDLVTLRALASDEHGHRSLPRVTFEPTELPFQQGARAADKTRELFGLGSGPISSVRDWIAEALPQLSVLYARLGPKGPAGLAFAGQSFGPTVVLNLDGKNRNPCVRRFSLIHELCHLLVDWAQPEPLAQISGYDTEAAREREQRANAFAMRFLCPESAVRRLPVDPQAAARVMVTTWGVHYSAARLYLRNVRSMQLPAVPSADFGPTGTEAAWEAAEAPDGVDNFPLVDVRPERSTIVALYAALAYSSGRIPRDAFAEYLGVTPEAEIEDVLDFFDLDPPGEPASAA
jgi:Zn-dependent peptidase ImmA (M78 family)